MSDWWTALSSREWALVSWIAIAIAAALTKPSLRRSLGQLLRILFRPIFVACYLSAGAYICAIVWLLNRYEIWTPDNLKTTIVWALTFAIVTMFQLTRLHDTDFYRRILREALNLTVLVVFITEFYTFPFVTEFLLIPVLVFFTLIMEVSKRDAQHKVVERLAGCVLGVIAASYVLYSTFRTFTDPTSLLTLDNGRDLVVPAALTVLFLPFIYVFGIWARYNDVFAILQLWLPDRRLRQYAKRQALLRFGPDVKTLDRWRYVVMTSRPETPEQVMLSIAEAWSMKCRDLHPADVTADEGWEPISASQMLADYRLGTLDYKPVGDGEWSASSPYLELGCDSALRRNNIAYYVSGSQFAATELALKLNINVPHEARSAEEHFIVDAFDLIDAAVGSEAAEGVKEELAALLPFSRHLEGTQIVLVREEWHGGTIKGGYDWTLRLKRGPPGSDVTK